MDQLQVHRCETTYLMAANRFSPRGVNVQFSEAEFDATKTGISFGSSLKPTDVLNLRQFIFTE